MHTSCPALPAPPGKDSSSKKRRRRVEGEGIKEIQYPEVIENHMIARHAVDDNNNSRQGSFSLEQSHPTRDHTVRTFWYFTSVSEVNAMNAHHHFTQRAGSVKQTKRDFRKKVALDLMRNRAYLEEQGAASWGDEQTEADEAPCGFKEMPPFTKGPRTFRRAPGQWKFQKRTVC